MVSADKPLDSPSLIGTIGGWAWACFCVVGPILQYSGPMKNPRSISPFVIFILLLSNIVRIFYWLASPFEISLLLQSFVMVAMQCLLLMRLTDELTADVKSNKMKKVTFINDGVTLQTFWKWTDFQSYQFFMSILTAPLLIGWFLFDTNATYGSILGYIALLIEAMLGMPQVYKFMQDGAKGADPTLFLTWLVGDLAKTAAFFGTGAPLPFIACGVIQSLTDVVILGQIAKDNILDKKPLPAHND